MIARLFLTLFIGFLSSLPYSLIVTLLPSEMKAHELTNQWYSCIIYYTYGVGWLLTSFFTVKCLFHYQGRLGSAIFGTIVLVNGMAMYLLSRIMTSMPLYLLLALLSRFIQGVGSGIAQTAFTSLITKKYVSQKARMMSLYLLGVLSGIKLGPFVGAYLEIKMGVFGMFALMAGLTLLKAIALYLYQDIPTPSKFQKFDNQIFSIHGVIFKAVPFFSFLNVFFSCLAFLNIEPLLASKWHELYGLSGSFIGYHFFISALLLPILALFLACLSQKHDRRILIIFGNLLSGVSQFFLAPSVIFGMQHSSTHLDVGLVLNTIGVALSFCFSFHEAWRSSLRSSYNPYIYDIIAAIITAVIGFEMTAGPIYVSILQVSVGFPAAMDTLGLLKIAFALVYGGLLVKEAVLDKHEEMSEADVIGGGGAGLLGEEEATGLLEGS